MWCCNDPGSRRLKTPNNRLAEKCVLVRCVCRFGLQVVVVDDVVPGRGQTGNRL